VEALPGHQHPIRVDAPQSQVSAAGGVRVASRCGALRGEAVIARNEAISG